MKKFYLIILSIIFIAGIVLVINKTFSNKENNTYTKDELKFFEEYKDLNIEKDNDVIYINKNNINDILSNKTVIFLGNSNNQNSKKLTPIIVNTISGSSISNLYYLDIEKNKDLKEIIKNKINIELNTNMVLFIDDEKVIDKYSYNSNTSNDDIYDELIVKINKISNNNCNEKC